jgi:hypothetical protein
MRRGSLQARSVNLRNVDLRELRAFRNTSPRALLAGFHPRDPLADG